MLSGNLRPFCLSLNVLIAQYQIISIYLLDMSTCYSLTAVLVASKFANIGFIMAYCLFNVKPLTHWGLVTPFGDIDLGQHWLR